MAEQGPFSNRVLGSKYLLGDLLGEGGFGAVYKAFNRPLNRPQAIKVLLEKHLRDPKFHQRFIREAQTLASLDHPHIVHVDELGEEPDVVYLVMPFISGGTLQGILKARSGPLGLEEVMRYLEHICSALGYAHAQRIVHLDLKPLNLLVHQDGRLLLSDFGLAHLMGQGAIEGGTSLQFGSPLYMAPEHFAEKPTQQSDLYALGVLLYQMLVGRPPFEASTPAAIMHQHLYEPPPPLHLARPDLPVALGAVLRKALAKQPEQRYGRADELLFDFRAALGGQALQFANAAEPTRLSQMDLDTTQRAANPSVSPARPTLAGSGPVTVPSDQSLVPPLPPLGSGPPPPPPIAQPGPIIHPSTPALDSTIAVPPDRRPSDGTMPAPGTMASGPIRMSTPVSSAQGPRRRTPPPAYPAVGTAGPPVKEPALPKRQYISRKVAVISLIVGLLVIAGGIALKLLSTPGFHQEVTTGSFHQEVTTGPHITTIEVGRGYDPSSQTIQGEATTFHGGEKVFVVFHLTSTDPTGTLTYHLFRGTERVLNKTIVTYTVGVQPTPGGDISGMYSYGTTVTTTGLYKWVVEFNGTPEASITFQVVS